MTAQPIARPTRRPGDFTGAPSTPWTMPDTLTANEAAAYRRAYARSTQTAARKSPAAVQHGQDGAPAPASAAGRMLARQLAGTTAANITARHDAAHRAGMTAVRKWIRDTAGVDTAARLEAIGAPARAPRKSTPAPVETTPTPAPVLTVVPPADETPAPVVESTPRPVVDTPADAAPELSPAEIGAAHAVRVPAGLDYLTGRAVRRAARRELAAALRAAGIAPTGDAWTAATTAAGIAGGAA